MKTKKDHIKELKSLFHADSLAVIGASGDKNKLGHEVFRAFLEMGYAGKLFPVNPARAGNIFGRPIYGNLKDIPEEVVLAVITAPPATLPGLLKDCLEKGVQGIIISGAPIEKEQPDLVEAIERVKSQGIRIIGPNSLGFHYPAGGLSIYPDLPRQPGSVGFISHSGAVAHAFISGMNARGIGCSKAVAVGNEWDLEWTDYFDYLGQDDETEIIAGYLEGMKNGIRFLNVARSVSKRKPVICIKAGQSESGGALARSHTGSIAGNRTLWKAVFDQTNVIHAADFHEAVSHIVMFRHLMARPLGHRIGLVTGTGGPTVITADLCEYYGLQVPELSVDTRKAIRSFLPRYGTSDRNPVDLSIAAGFDHSLYSLGIQALDRSPEVDVIVCIHTGDYSGEAVVGNILKSNLQVTKPLVMIMMGATEKNTQNVKLLSEAGFLAFDGLEQTIRSLSLVIKWKEKKRKDRTKG